MSTRVSQTEQVGQPATRPARSQFEHYVEEQLESTRQQVKVTELTAGLLTLGLWLLGILLLGILADSWLVEFSPAARLVAFAVLVGGGLWIGWTRIGVLFRRRIHRLYAAQMIESGSENLHNSLVNYLHVKESGQVDREAVVQAISQRAARDLSQISTTEKVDRTLAIQLGFGLVGLVAALVAYTLLSPKSPWPSIARILNPVSTQSAPTVAQIVAVNPGPAEIFFGQKLLVTAEIRGRHLPDDVRLVYSTDDGQHVAVPLQMLPTGSGGTYQAELSTTPSGIDGPLSYHVTANDGRSPDYSVRVKPNPAIALEQIEVRPPAYTRLPNRTITGQNEIEGLEGSQVRLTAVANLPIQVAWVELLRQQTRGRETSYEIVRTIELRNDEPQQASGEFILSLDANRTRQSYTHYQLLFRTVDGQRNPLVNVQPLRVSPDLPPVVKVVRPFDREVEVPLNRSLELELQAEDPDFEISRLQLLLDHQGGLLLDEDVELSDNRKQQRLIATYRFEPRKLRLSVGDEVIFHGRASDNRVAALSGQPDPNIARTENYKIRITAPLETEIAESNPEEGGAQTDAADAVAGKQDGTPTGGNQPRDPAARPEEVGQANQPTGDPTGNSVAEAQTSQPSSSNAGKQPSSQSQPSEPAQAQSAEQPSQPQGDNQANSNQPAAKPTETMEQPATSEKPADPPQPRQPEQDSGQEAGQPASGSGSDGNQSGNGNADQSQSQPESGKQGEQPGATQANPQATEQQTGNRRTEQKSGNQSPAEGSKQAAEKPESGSEPNQGSNPAQPEGSGQPSPQKTPAKPSEPKSGEPPSGQAGSQAGGNQTAANQKSEQANPGQSAGQQSTGNQTGSGQSAPKSDGQSGSQSSGNGGGQTGQPGDSPNSRGDATGAPDNADSTSGDSRDDSGGEQPGSESTAREPLDKSATDAERFRRIQERMDRQRQGAENAPPRSAPAGQKDPTATEDSARSTGDQAGQPPRSAGKQSPSAGEPSGRPEQQTAEPQTARPQPPRPEGGRGSDQPGGKQGEQGSQQPGEDQSGDQSGQSGKSGQSGSDSQSGGASAQSGDQAGKQPGGQSGSQSGEGGESSGSSPASGGSGKNPQSGQTGNQAGQGGSASSPAGGQPSAASGSSGNAAGADNAKGTDSEISRRSDQPSDRRSSAGQANPLSTGAGSNESPPSGSDDPAAEAEGNLEYSEKATDLVLEHLRNQAHNPDPDLLQEMNWTEQELQDFLARWEAMKQTASSGTPQARNRYADALRSLGLRSEEVRRNVLQARRDQLNKLSEDGAVNRPPANLAEPFNAFLKNRNRVQKEK